MCDRVPWLERPILQDTVLCSAGLIALWGDHVPLLVHHAFSHVSGLRLTGRILLSEQTKVVSDR